MACPLCQREHPETVAKALSILASTPRRLERLASTMSPRATAARPMRDKWSAKEILAHLTDGEIVYAFRYRKLVAEPGAQLAAFDEKAWANELLYRKRPLKTLLENFSALRKQNLALLKLLPRSAWSMASPHPEYGALSLRELVVHLAYHDRNHAQQVERIAKALGGGKRKKKSAKRTPRKAAGKKRRRR
jgi:DinB superfamily